MPGFGPACCCCRGVNGRGVVDAWRMVRCCAPARSFGGESLGGTGGRAFSVAIGGGGRGCAFFLGFDCLLPMAVCNGLVIV